MVLSGESIGFSIREIVEGHSGLLKIESPKIISIWDLVPEMV
jgi:hypothetical protein